MVDDKESKDYIPYPKPIDFYWDKEKGDCDKYSTLNVLVFSYLRSLYPEKLQNVYMTHSSHEISQLNTHSWNVVYIFGEGEEGEEKLYISYLDASAYKENKKFNERELAEKLYGVGKKKRPLLERAVLLESSENIYNELTSGEGNEIYLKGGFCLSEEASTFIHSLNKQGEGFFISFDHRNSSVHELLGYCFNDQIVFDDRVKKRRSIDCRR